MLSHCACACSEGCHCIVFQLCWCSIPPQKNKKTLRLFFLQLCQALVATFTQFLDLMWHWRFDLETANLGLWPNVPPSARIWCSPLRKSIEGESATDVPLLTPLQTHTHTRKLTHAHTHAYTHTHSYIPPLVCHLPITPSTTTDTVQLD